MTEYPQCEELSRLATKRGHITEFLEWLCYESPIILCELRNDDFQSTNKTFENITMDFLGIDEKVLEQERRAILDEQRKRNHEQG